jgi:hypothetical protein
MTGYRGRFSIVEILPVTAEVERMVGASENADKIAEVGRKAGMLSLWESGLAHVFGGESTIDELLRVVDVPQDHGVGREKRLLLQLPRQRRRSRPNSNCSNR